MLISPSLGIQLTNVRFELPDEDDVNSVHLPEPVKITFEILSFDDPSESQSR